MFGGAIPLVFNLILWSTCYAAVSKPFWVNPQGKDSNDCGESRATACKTLAYTVSHRAKGNQNKAQIYMLPGTYVHNFLTLFDEFQELNISGFNPSATAVRITCAGAQNTLSFDAIPRIFLDNISITDCHSPTNLNGGAVSVSRSGLHLRNVIVANSTSIGNTFVGGNGGCVAATSQSTVFVRNSTFVNCTTTGRGGALFVDVQSTTDLKVCVILFST